jgi:hypothetical protein
VKAAKPYFYIETAPEYKAPLGLFGQPEVGLFGAKLSSNAYSDR